MLPGAFADQNPGLSWPPPFKTLSEPCQVWCCHWNKLDNTCNVGKQLLCVIPPEQGQNPRTKGDFAFVLRAVALFSSVQPNMGTPHTRDDCHGRGEGMLTLYPRGFSWHLKHLAALHLNLAMSCSSAK